jgi:hypothetical protein
MLKNRTGSVYIEFIIVIIPFLALFLGLTQLGLLMAADLLVKHAAAKAARAAIVIFPDDAQNTGYNGVPVNQIGSGDSGLSAYKHAKSGGRYETVRTAAEYVLAPLSPPIKSAAETTLHTALGKGAVSSITGFGTWTKQAVALSFPDGSGTYASAFGPRGNITAEVTFLYKCSVPIGKNLVCKSYSRIDRKKRKLLELKGGLLKTANINSNWKFAALQARVTLPNQGRR